MSGAECLTEICATFPAREIAVTGQGVGAHGTTMGDIFPETKCAWCGERFVFNRQLHRYKRHRGGKLYLFCKYSCLKSFDKARPDLRKKRVEDCKKRLEYLESLRDIPREQWSDPRIRDNGKALSSMIENAEKRLNTAYYRCLRYMEE